MKKKSKHLETMQNMLHRLQENGPMTSDDFAREFGLSTSTVGSMMGYLGRLGAVTKIGKTKHGKPAQYVLSSSGLSASNEIKRKEIAASTRKKKGTPPSARSYNDRFWGAFLSKQPIPKK